MKVNEGPNGTYFEVNANCLDEDGSIRDNLSLSETALWKLKGFLDALGMEAEGVTELVPADWKGMLFDAEIYHEPYQGRMQARVSEFFESEFDGDAPADAEEEVEEEAEDTEEEEDSEVEQDGEGEELAITPAEVDDMTTAEIVSLLEELGIESAITSKTPAMLARKKAKVALNEAGLLVDDE